MITGRMELGLGRPIQLITRLGTPRETPRAEAL